MAAEALKSASRKLSLAIMKGNCMVSRTFLPTCSRMCFTLSESSGSFFNSRSEIHISTVEYHNSRCLKTQQSYLSTKDLRIRKLLNVLGSLMPHMVLQKQIADELDVQDRNEDQIASQTAYSSFSRLEPVILQTLADHPNLVMSEDATANAIGVIETLHGNLGFGLRVIVRLLSRNPELFEINETVLKRRVQNFRILNLRDGMLQRALSRTPQYLCLPEDKITKMASFLTDDMDFTTKELPGLFLFAPQVFLDPPEQTEEKFQYIYFAMGYKEHFMLAKYGVMRYSLGHIRTRHLFLERRGQFQLADKNQTVTIKNPGIRNVICSTDAHFCKEIALCRIDEFQIFKKILGVETNLRKMDSELEPPTPPDEFADKLLKDMS